MGIVRISVSLAVIVGVIAATIAAAVIWLLLTDPVGAAEAVGQLSQGDMGPLLRAVGSAISAALQGLFKYL